MYGIKCYNLYCITKCTTLVQIKVPNKNLIQKMNVIITYDLHILHIRKILYIKYQTLWKSHYINLQVFSIAFPISEIHCVT